MSRKLSHPGTRGIGGIAKAVPVALCLAFAALRADAAPAAQSAALTADVLALEQAALALERAQGSEQMPLVVYLGNRAPQLLLVQLQIQVDDGALQRYSLSSADSRALQDGGLYRLVMPGIGPGEHRLRADVIARENGASPSAPRLRSQVDTRVSKGPGSDALLLSLSPRGFGRDAELTLQTAGADAPELDLGNIRFLSLTGRHFPAAAALAAQRERSGGRLTPDAEMLLAQSTAALGLGADPAAAGEAPLSFAQYQNALSMLEGGRAAEGIATLDRIGRSEAVSATAWALRDKANVALGYHFLAAREGKSASELFRRVRSPGPYSNAALLGLGWSLLIAPGSGKIAADGAAPAAAEAGLRQASLRPQNEDELAEARRLAPFRNAWAVADDKRAEDLRRALVPWAEMIGRDPTDAAVQEAMLAIPYALGHLGAQQQAQSFTLRAVDLYEATRSQVDAAQRHVRSGGLYSALVLGSRDTGGGWEGWLARMPEPRWWLTAPGKAPENFYFERLLASDRFREALDEARRMQLLLETVEARAADPATAALRDRAEALRPRVAAAVQGQRQALESVALDELALLRRQTERYLGEARFSLARLHDRPAEQQP